MLLRMPAGQYQIPSSASNKKDNKGKVRYLPLYAIKTNPASDKAPLEGDGVEEARQDYDQFGKPAIKMQMTRTGSKHGPV